MKLDDGHRVIDFSELTTGELLSIIFTQPYATNAAKVAAWVEYSKRRKEQLEGETKWKELKTF